MVIDSNNNSNRSSNSNNKHSNNMSKAFFFGLVCLWRFVRWLGRTRWVCTCISLVWSGLVWCSLLCLCLCLCLCLRQFVCPCLSVRGCLSVCLSVPTNTVIKMIAKANNNSNNNNGNLYFSHQCIVAIAGEGYSPTTYSGQESYTQ